MVSAADLLRRRLEALLQHSGRTRKDLAIYLGKQPSWATEFFQGRYDLKVRDLDRAARFFGVSVPQLFEVDGYRFRDRRMAERRIPFDRRKAQERRKHERRRGV